MESCCWFGAGLRASMAVGLEDIVQSAPTKRRKCFYDEEGKDIRLSVPGVRWADVRKLRKDALDNFKSNCQEVFQQIYDQISGTRRDSMSEHDFLMSKTEVKTSTQHSLQTLNLPLQSKPTPPLIEEEDKRMDVQVSDSTEVVSTNTLSVTATTVRRSTRLQKVEKVKARKEVKVSIEPKINQTQDFITAGSTDSGMGSETQHQCDLRYRRSESTNSLCGGKRLRSVSLERISLSEIEAKRISICLTTPTAEDDGVSVSSGRDKVDEGVGEMVSPDKVTDPDDKKICSDEANTVSSGDSDEASPSTPTHQGTSSYEPMTPSPGDSQDNIDTSPEEGDRHCSSQVDNVIEIEAKRISICLATPTGEDDGRDEVEDGVTEMVSPDEITDPDDKKIFSSEENALSSDEISPTHQGASSDEPLNSSSGDSQENMDTSPVSSESPTGSSGDSDNGSSSEDIKRNTRSALNETVTKPDFTKSPVVNLKRTKASPWALLSHKTHFHMNDLNLKSTLLPSGNRQATFLSPNKSSPNKRLDVGGGHSGLALPQSFLAKNSPQQIQKAESRIARQMKLLEHIQRKEEVEEQRIRELEEKKLQEAENRKKRNDERAKRAAERRRQEENKKILNLRKKAEEQEDGEFPKKLNRLKNNERLEKTKKHNERVAAVLARKKQGDEEKARKLQQIKEDRIMAEELHRQRLEREEDERQARRAEKQKQERERQLLREEEERERQTNKDTDNKPEHDSIVLQPKMNKPTGTVPPALKKQDFKQLLASTFTLAADSAQATAKDLFITPHKHNCSIISSNTANKTSPNGDSYKMTPAQPRSSNYDIDNLSCGDSTDEEDCPKKPIPSWATTSKLRTIMVLQEEHVYNGSLDFSDVFPPKELLMEVDLARIFKMKRKRFYHRSSSAQWDSPVLLKRGRIDKLRLY